MSRRPPNPGAERAAQNQATIKSLLKLEANKICADCKRNKHPRWASWNLGVFICIRCSGIHRGMGTHISRVKSVDLDSWTDEQMQSILSWGNARANKYWEAKLAANHMPSESKIENFIRTKYELKRWVMEGPIPDPATLDVEGDDDIPLSVVKEKHNVKRRESVRKASVGKSAAPQRIPAPQADLIGGDDPVLPQRASTVGPPGGSVPPKAAPAPPKPTSTKDSLLGLDFLGSEPSAPPRPASTTGTPAAGGQSRPDLKQSILSLYASAPRPQAQPPQQPSHAPSGSFSSMQAPMQSPGNQNQGAFGGMNDAFSSLSFSNPTGPTSPKNDAFANLGNMSSRPKPQTNSSAFSGLSGGSFFDSKPPPSAPTHQAQPSFGNSSSFGGFASPPPVAAPAPAPVPAAATPSSGLGGLFDFSSPAPLAPAAPVAAAPSQSVSPPLATNSVFNLSAQPKAPATNTTTTAASNPLGSMGGSSAWGDANVWGGSNAWATPEPPKKAPEPQQPAPRNDFGWGGSAMSNPLAGQSIVPGASGGFAPKVAADEEFGGWTSSGGGGGNASANTSGAGSKPAGGFGGQGEDLFSNVWQ